MASQKKKWPRPDKHRLRPKSRQPRTGAYRAVWNLLRFKERPPDCGTVIAPRGHRNQERRAGRSESLESVVQDRHKSGPGAYLRGLAGAMGWVPWYGPRPHRASGSSAVRGGETGGIAAVSQRSKAVRSRRIARKPHPPEREDQSRRRRCQRGGDVRTRGPSSATTELRRPGRSEARSDP